MVASPVWAAGVVIDVPESTVLTQGGADLIGTVDISSYLKAGGHRYTADDVMVSVVGSSGEHGNQGYEIDNPFVLLFTIQRPNSQGQIVDDNFYQRQDSNVRDDTTVDSLTLKVGADGASGADGNNYDAGAYGLTSVDMVGTFDTGLDFLITETNVIDEGYFGDLGASLTASPATLAQINGTGSVGFDVAATGDPTQVTGVQVSFDQVLAAPEPATWAMMLVGVAGLGVALRRIRRTPAAA